MHRPRPLMEAAWRGVEAGHIPIIVAPTGYGKTRASPWLYEEARKRGLASGLIHVAPLRSLVTKIYRDIFKPASPRAGYQAHIDLGGDRSSYFLRDLVVTTVDSFLWNLYRLPVTELMAMEKRVTMGHYYPVYTSIYTSLTVLDEAHVYLGGGGPDPGRAAFVASLMHLANLDAPLVVETATMHPSILGWISLMLELHGRKASIATLDCYASRLQDLLGPGVRVDGVGDGEWVRGYRLKWRTSIVDGWDSVLDDIISDSSRGPVLVVANTVKTAISLYSSLKDRIEDEDIVLIHGRLASRDREAVEKRIGSMKRGVIVATQVVEVGVDVNAIAVYSEAAPIENLVQRAGRACRRGEALGQCRSRGGKLVVVRPRSHQPYERHSIDYTIGAVEKHGVIDWRLPCTEPKSGVTPYTRLIEEAGDDTAYSLAPYADLYEVYLNGDGRPSAMLDLLNDMGLCSIYRDSSMYPIRTTRGEVLVDLKWLSKNWAKILDTSKGVRITIMRQNSEIDVGIREEDWKEAINPGRRCRHAYTALNKLVSRAAKDAGIEGVFSWMLKAREGAYHRGLGFTVDLEEAGVL